MTHHYVAGEGALWAQIDGANTAPVYLGCHQLGDVDEPLGDIELVYCQDASGPSRYKVVNSVQGAAGAVTSSLTTDITDDLDYLEQIKCEATIFVHMAQKGRRDVFTNFDRTFVLLGVRVTNRGLTGVSSRTPDDNARSEMTFDISAQELLRPMEQTISRTSISETSDINDISFCNEQSCRTDSDPAQAICQEGFAGADAAGGATANVLVTTNGGTWAATSADPFGTDEHVIAVECFPMDASTTRVIAARGSTDVANPAEISYSDDSGANWTAVNVGSTNGAFVEARFALFALNRNNIWVGTDGGYLFYSSDAGGSFTAQESGVITTDGIWCIRMVDESVGWFCGESNIIARTLDGGDSWGAIAGPAAEAGNDAHVIEPLDQNRVWVGYSSGKMYYTNNGGSTWSERTFSGSGVGAVRDIRFLNELHGYMARDNASPVGNVLWTIDGGYTWMALTTPTNAGLNALALCDQWTFFVCGEDQGSTGFIAKATVA